MGPGLARVTHLDASFLGGDRDAFQSARGTGPTSCFPGEVREGHLKIMCALAEAWSQAEHQRTPNFQWWLIAREETFSRTVLCLLKRILVPSPRKLAFKCVALARLGHKSATNARIILQMAFSLQLESN